MLKAFYFLSAKVEPYVHGVSMKGLKAGTTVLPFIWPKTFEGEQPSLALCRHIIKKAHRSVFFVTSKTPVRTGLVKPMIDALEAAGVQVTVHDAVKPDPTIEDIESAVAELKAAGCDAVVTLGGGSCIDAAKVIAARAKNKKSIAKMTGMLRVSRGMLPLYAVPTTAGTGSEVTIAAVVTDAHNQRKLPIVDPRLMPRAVALDGSLMLGVPADITAATGMDALTHAVEAFISLNASKKTDKLALEATRLIMENLPAVVADGSHLQGR
ncbi:MAG: iron-containing alcohol dehydrogenase, partial [Nevskiales bacterium]